MVSRDDGGLSTRGLRVVGLSDYDAQKRVDLRLRCAPGRIRTCGTRFRKPLLYPLSYGGSQPNSLRV